MSITANIQTHLDSSKYLTGSFVDLKKAFFIVDHDIPIKSWSIMVSEVLQKNWLISYLKGRKRIVVIENETSATKEILKGLPQAHF